MTDYRKLPLGPLAPGRIGEIVECPHCHERGLKVEDFKDAASGSKEKEIIYVHLEGGVPIQREENGRTIEEIEIMTLACSRKTKQTPPKKSPVARSATKLPKQ